MIRTAQACVLLVLIGLSLSCGTSRQFAPVSDISSLEPIPPSGSHRVAAGETLYEIAWRYGLDYRELAIDNQIRSPYFLSPDQQIKLRSGTWARQLARSSGQPADELKSSAITNWVWPARGRLTVPFEKTRKGINIVGKLGDPVVASQSGRVVYAGDGLRGYGHLILIQHDESYLSAYAHNRRLSVKQGQWVKRGQKIAEMGNLGSPTPTLHFEVRKAGKPVNPMNYIK